MSGLKAWKARAYQPSTSPSGTPRRTARVNPHDTRNSEATIYLNNKPFCSSSMMPLRTLPGVGNKSLCDKRTARPHTVKNKAAIPTGRTIRQTSESGSPTRTDVRRGVDADLHSTEISAPVFILFRFPGVRLHRALVGHK